MEYYVSWIQRICVSQRSIIFIHLPFLHNARDLNSFVKHSHVHLHFKNLDHSNLGPKTSQRIAFNGILEERTRKNVSISRFRLRNFRSNILFPTRDRIFPYRDSAHRNLPRSKFSSSLVHLLQDKIFL